MTSPSETPAALREEIRALAQLARLDLTEDEVLEIAATLTGVLSALRAMQKAHTAALASMHVLHTSTAPPRGDVVAPSLPQGRVLRAAASRGAFVRVPRVL